MHRVIISVLGPDRPGIIAAAAKILFASQCNIENVSQTILQNEFSGIFIVTAPDDLSIEALSARLGEGLTSLRQHVFIKPVTAGDSGFDAGASEPFVITTRGPDQKGLVARITEIIARHGVNVTNLQAAFKGGEDPGDNIMIYEVDVPPETDFENLQQDLRARAEELGLTISIQHRRIFETINRV